MPDYGKFEFVVWTSYGLTAVVLGALIALILWRKRDR